MTTDAQPVATNATTLAGAHSDSPTRLHGRGLRLARVAWMILIVLDLLLFSRAIPATFNASVQQGLTTDHDGLAQLSMSVEAFAAFRTSLALAGTLISLVIAMFLFWSRSDDWIVLLVAFVFVTVAPGTAFAMGALGATQPSWLVPAALQISVGLIATALLVFTFPTGRFVPTWTRPALILFAVFALANAGASIVQQTSFDPAAALIVCYSLGVIAQIYRYRRAASAIQRQQFRWIVFGFFIYAPIFIIFSLLSAFVAPTLPEPRRILFELWGPLLLFYVPALLLFMTAVFAILRYRLWDIDVIINRTLVYVPLTAMLAGIFAASITLTQKFFIAVTGQSSDAATVLTTLIVVAAFDPLKNGLQHLVDRRFKEARDPNTEINQFGEEVQAVIEVLDAEQLARRFLETAVRAYEATGGAVYVQSNGGAPLVQHAGAWDGEARLRVPLQHEGVEVGRLELGARKKEQDYGDAERAALQMNAARIARALTLLQGL